MKKQRSNLFRLFGGLTAGLAAVCAAQGGSFNSDFSSAPASANVYGSAVIEDGTLKLTKLEGSQQGGFVIDDLDAGATITGFTATFRLLIGGGTGADGFSFNFGSDVPDGTAGEEGVGTGLTISFDTYDNGGGEAPAIDVKKGGQVMASAKGIGSVFRNNTLNQVRVNVDSDGSLDLSVGSTVVYTNLIGAFAPAQGRFLLGARTGGSYDNHWVDDLNITTRTDVPTGPVVITALPQFSDVSPGAAVYIQLEDRTTAVNTSTVKLKFDGTEVAVTPSKVGAVTTVSYDPPGLMGPLSTHTVELTYSDTGTPPAAGTVSYSFTVSQFVAIPSSTKVTPDTSKPGFIWRVFANQLNQENSTARAEAALAGQLLASDGTPLPNLADPFAQGVAIGPAAAPSPENAPIQFEIATVINVSQNGTDNAGNFPTDDVMPGIPALDGTDNGIAAEILTFIELPAGATQFGILSDDGFRATAGVPRDVFEAIQVGLNEGGTGERRFTVVVEEAGVYAFRVVWEEGGGGAHIEWYTYKADGSRALVNDTANGGLKAYRAASTELPPYVKTVIPDPVPRQANAVSSALTLILADGTPNKVDDNSVVLKYDGQSVTPTKTRSGNTLTLKYAPAGLQIPAESHTAELTFKDATGAYSRTVTWNFRNVKNLVLPTPKILETFDSYPEDSQPPGWTAWNYTARGGGERNITDQTSLSYEDWVLTGVANISSIDGARPFNITPGQLYNGVEIKNADPPGGTFPEWLMSGNVLYAESDSRPNADALGRGYEGQTQFITSKPFDCSTFAGVVLSFSSIYEQNQDSLGSVEYSIDGGTTWLPVMYFLEQPDIKLNADGTVDAVRTFNDANTDTSSWVINGVTKGDKYGDGIAAPITAALGDSIVPRINDGQVEGKRIEVARLVGAGGQADVRLRLAQLGTDSWYFAVDNIAFYDIAEPVTEKPTIAVPTVAGGNLTITWTGGGTLEKSSDVTTGWTSTGDSDGSYTAPVGAGNEFFRVKR